jgi:hypothetical protein
MGNGVPITRPKAASQAQQLGHLSTGSCKAGQVLIDGLELVHTRALTVSVNTYNIEQQQFVSVQYTYTE